MGGSLITTAFGGMNVRGIPVQADSESASIQMFVYRASVAQGMVAPNRFPRTSRHGPRWGRLGRIFDRMAGSFRQDTPRADVAASPRQERR